MTLNINSLLASLETEAQIEKSASAVETTTPAVSAELASVLEKKASEDLTTKAFSEGEALAKALLEKMANEIIADNAQMVADDDQKVLPNPGGTVEQVLEGVVENAKATGAASDDRVDGEGAHANNVAPAGDPVEAEKQAADASAKTKEENTMDKQASDSELAKFIMEKLAQEFSPEVTTDAAAVNTAAAPAPNKIQRDNAVMTAQDDAKVQGVVPGGDGTVNALFETIVANAVAQGGQSDDLINGASHVAERADHALMVGGPGPASEGQEKAAAVSALVAEGMDFDMAVDLVKQAELEIQAESWEQEKQACLDLLMQEGVNFDDAVALVKQAEEDMMKEAAGPTGTDKRIRDTAKVDAGRKVQAGKAALKEGIQRGVVNARVGANNVVFGARNLDGKIFGRGVRQLASNRLVQAGGAVGLAAAGGAALMGREKKACVEALMNEGIDFDTAVELTKQASIEVYGE